MNAAKRVIDFDNCWCRFEIIGVRHSLKGLMDRRLYVNSLRRGRGYDGLSIFWKFFSNSSTFFWKKCHFWRLISRDLGLPNGSNWPFWVGKSFFYAQLCDAEIWKCTVFELWALEDGIKNHFFWKLRKPMFFEGTYTKNWAINGGQTCFED